MFEKLSSMKLFSMLDTLSSMETFYLACAVIGGGMFILRSIMMVVGLGDDHHDGDTGDLHTDADGSPMADFKMVSINGITAFVLMFGATGFLMLRNQQGAPWLVGAIAFAVGLAMMFTVAKLFHLARKLQSDGTIHPHHAVGAEGSVYLTIRPAEIGKVQLTVRGAFKIFDARANNPATTLKTGDAVKVVSAGNVLVVEPA
jgi:hypothetical protein